MAKAKASSFPTTVNIPLTNDMKRRLGRMAKAFPGSPKPTPYARILLEDAISRAESGQQPINGHQGEQVAGAKL